MVMALGDNFVLMGDDDDHCDEGIRTDIDNDVGKNEGEAAEDDNGNRDDHNRNDHRRGSDGGRRSHSGDPAPPLTTTTFIIDITDVTDITGGTEGGKEIEAHLTATDALVAKLFARLLSQTGQCSLVIHEPELWQR